MRIEFNNMVSVDGVSDFNVFTSDKIRLTEDFNIELFSLCMDSELIDFVPIEECDCIVSKIAVDSTVLYMDSHQWQVMVSYYQYRRDIDYCALDIEPTEFTFYTDTHNMRIGHIIRTLTAQIQAHVMQDLNL